MTIRVCQCCYRLLNDDNTPADEKWRGQYPATHGNCSSCNLACRLYGYDFWVNATKGDRDLEQNKKA